MAGTDPGRGLTAQDVETRKRAGQVNICTSAPGKTTGQILRENLLTLFNLLNVALAAWVVSVGSYKNVLFMGVVVLNAFIGVFQALRAKKAVEKLRLISAPTALAVRDGNVQKIAVEEIVLGDVLEMKSGMQVCADCVLRNGEMEADESLITGESDPVGKKPGDELRSGSFIVSGAGRVEAVRVGDDAYAAKIARTAKRYVKPNSELMTSLARIMRFVSIVLVPLGLLLFAKAFYIAGDPYRTSVVSSVAAMIGMIPEGLMLLTSVALAVGVVRLASRQTLAQNLYAMETLARVDVLCMDKTGTITTGEMAYEGMIPLDVPEDQAVASLKALLGALGEGNATASALKKALGATDCRAARMIPFSSARKFSGAVIGEDAFALGAAEFIMKGGVPEALSARIAQEANKGRRVLLLAQADGFDDRQMPVGDVVPLALFLLSDVIRAEAPDTIAYFKSQGVEMKIISGDDPRTVSAIALRAGIEGEAVDMSTVEAGAALEAAALRYRVFGRVTPEKKEALVKALKAAGRVVAMTGDGVNDVPALKTADCAVAMGSGSDAARQVASLVLLDGNFASLPKVVDEGRRVINNIRRSASLFLTKTLFSFITAVFTLIAADAYPLEPIQLTLFSAACIGLPSFLLALEPNRNRVEGGFLAFVVRNALPGALALALGVTVLGRFPDEALRGTLSALFMLGVGIANVVIVCLPVSRARLLVIAASVLTAAGGVLLLPGLFGLAPLTGRAVPWLLTTLGCAIPALFLLVKANSALCAKFDARKRLHS